MKRLGVLSIPTLLVVTLCALSAQATNAEMYFSSDKNGQSRVTNVQEGSSVWIVVHDPDENIDCDVRDKIWTDVKIMDPKTGAYIVWVSYEDKEGDAAGQDYDDEDYVPYKGHYPGNPGWLGGDYLEETAADTSLFVSERTFQVGSREDYDEPRMNTHVVADAWHPIGGLGLDDFQGGGWIYLDGTRGFIDEDLDLQANGIGPWSSLDDLAFPDDAIRGEGGAGVWVVGRFENMDTLLGVYQDQNDETDVATAMMKIIDTEATITWDQEIYKDANGAATITVTDADENLNCNAVEYVPVFILVNPGSWNPVDGTPWTGQGGRSPTNFCMLKRTGGVDGATGKVGDTPIRWYTMYHSWLNGYDTRGAEDGRYYVQYATEQDSSWNVVWFDTVDEDGITAVSFYAQETGVNTGVFQLNLNSILDDLGFNSLEVRDVLVAYYLDPNDEDDFKLDAAYIEEKATSITTFTDATRQNKDVYWLGRDPVYVQVIDANANVDPCCPEQVVVLICDVHEEDDAEWILLDETGANSPVFFTFAGMELDPVWDAMGVGEGFFTTIQDAVGVRPRQGGSLLGGYQLVLDNWKIEAFNEDDIFVQYNDAYYGAPPNVGAVETSNDVSDGLAGLGDSDTNTSFPPLITNGPIADDNFTTSVKSIGGSPGTRVPNDISFALMSIGDTQVYNGQTVNMYFLDRQGNRVQGYANSDCVFIEVVDPDQNEDVLRRERVDAFWDAGQSGPIGPESLNDWDCGVERVLVHPWNRLFGDTNIFNNSPANGSGWYYNLETGDDGAEDDAGGGKLYVANPRNGRWAPVDLLETGIGTGDFVSVICVDLVNVYTCVPTLGALPGDTIVAFYQDPSNHSDSAMISVKVGIGGGTTPPSQSSTTTFTNVTGVAVANYTDADLVYVKVVDPSHAGASLLENAVTIDGRAFSLAHPAGWAENAFVTTGLDLNLAAGATITATYKDPTDPTDTSSKTITVIASKLEIDRFYARPSPASGPVTFGYEGTGIASVMSVAVYDLAGHLVWTSELANVTKIVWSCGSLANGAYIYLVTATDGTDTFNDKGTLFINR
jgi:hypothetical protein